MGSKARYLSDGLQTRNQLITGRDHRIPRILIPYGQYVTAPRVGKVSTLAHSNNEVFCYIMPANPGTQAHIVCSLPSKRSFQMYIRKDVRPLNLTSQIQLLKNIQNVDLTTTSTGEYQISGMREPTSVYNDEGYPDTLQLYYSLHYSLTINDNI